MRHLKMALAATLIVGAPRSIRCQQSTVTSVPIRELSQPEARTSDRFGLILNVRSLSDGRLLVNDGAKRQLLMYESNLTGKTVVLDSVPIGGHSYGIRGTALIPSAGDSSLLVDVASVSLVIVGPDGRVAGAIAPPIAAHIRNLSIGGAGVDNQGNLIYSVEESRTPLGRSRDSSSVRKAIAPPDSALVLKVNFESRKVDTVGRIKSPSLAKVKISFENRGIVATYFGDPLPSQDDFAVLSDGTIALVRSNDFHIDLILPTGQHISGLKIPFAWKPVTDSARQSLLDSAKAREAADFALARPAAAAPTPSQSISRKESDLGGGIKPNSGDGVTSISDIERRYEWLRPGQIADYYPPIRRGALKADADGNLWILPTTSALSNSGELVYDVVNGQGKLIYHARLPKDRSIAGFGKGEIVFLMSRDTNGWMLERTRVRP